MADHVLVSGGHIDTVLAEENVRGDDYNWYEIAALLGGAGYYMWGNSGGGG